MSPFWVLFWLFLGVFGFGAAMGYLIGRDRDDEKYEDGEA